MRLYLLPVMGMCFVVDGLLLGAAGALTERKPPWLELGVSSALGAIYGGACLLPEVRFLGGIGFRIIVLLVMGLMVYGLRSFCVAGLFCALNLCCNALALMMDGPMGALTCGLMVALLMLMASSKHCRLVPVELCWEDKSQQVMALRDTGNGLRDPITGEQVLVVGPEVAGRLLGLSRNQLKHPVETLADRPLPGLRLIPYNSVGGGGLMLALRLPRVRIGRFWRSSVVAFAGEGLQGAEGFEALTGGNI